MKYFLILSLITFLLPIFSPANAAGSGFNDCYNIAKSVFTYKSDAIKTCGNPARD